MMCSPTFVLVVAGLTGLAVASLTGSDPQGWVAGAVAGAAAWAALRLAGRGRAPSCPVPPAEPRESIVLPDDRPRG